MSGSAVVESIPVLKRNLGVTDIEAKVVLSVFLGGNLTPGGIAEITGESVRKVQQALKRLETKGLVVKVDGMVTVYRLAPSILAMEDVLSSISSDLESYSEETKKVYESNVKKIDQSVESVVESHRGTIDDGKVALQSYETKTVETVQSQIDMIASLTTRLLTDFIQSIETTLAGFDTTLDDSLGSRLTALHQELDRSQRELSRVLTKISKDYKKTVKKERRQSVAAVDGLRNKIASLIQSLNASVAAALDESLSAVQASGVQMSQRIAEESTSASGDAISVLASASEELERIISHLEAQLSATYLAGEETLKEVASKSRLGITDEAEFAKGRIEDAIQISESAKTNVEAWQNEVGAFTEVAFQSLKSQIDQMQSTESNYLDNLRKASTGLIDRTQALYSEEYETLKGMAAGVHSDFGDHLADSRNSTLELLDKQMNAHETKLESANTEALANIEKLSKTAIRSLSTNLNQIIRDIGEILDTEAAEMDTLAEAINSRLKSAFNTVITTSKTKQESAITSVKKMAHDFEADVGNRLSEVIAEFASTSKSQIREAKNLYTSLNERVDTRLAQGVSALTAHASRVQKEVDTAIEEQVARIDEHTKAIRDEFHLQLEDITRQFINLTRGIEATFNGFLSSQTTEARDLISSVHTEFKGSLKTEMISLEEDSQRLQQEFAVELGLKVEELVGAVDAMRKALEEITVEKRTEISQSMAEALSGIDDAVRSTQDALKDMESGTIRQFGDNLVQVSKEFKSTIGSARDTISEKVSRIKDSTEDSMTTNTGMIESAIDTYFTDQRDSREKLLAATSKKMDALASKLLRKSDKQVEAFQVSLTKKEASASEAVRKAREQAMSAIEERRSEVALAFIGASEGLETASGNLASSLEQLGSKLNAEIASMSNVLTKSADQTALKIGERGEKTLKEFERLSRDLLKKSEASITVQSTQFGENAAVLLTGIGESLSDMPIKFREIITTANSEATQKVDDYCQGARDSIKSSFSKFTELSEPVAEEARGLLDRVSTQATKGLDTSLAETQQTNLEFIQHAARRLESIGRDLQTYLGGESSRLMENLRSDLAAKTAEIGGSASKAATDTKEGMSLLRQERNDALNSLAEHADKTMRQWGTQQKKTLTSIRSQFDEAVKTVSQITEQTSETLKAVKAAGQELLAIPSDKTWYVTGKNEICAHMMDMMSRAEKSVVVSVLSLDCLDIKKLARVKKPRRKVLIVPELEEGDTTLDALQGWRIWQTSSPTTLAVVDDSEILVGGSEPSDADIALVSTEASYLQLYRDFIGPRLTKGRITRS
ncbi:MAG: helix-turn-helix domain-containing protein [Promethearchaeota archaeon]